MCICNGLKVFCIYKPKQDQLDYAEEGNEKWEGVFADFVAKEKHAEKSACSSAEGGDAPKNDFRYPRVSDLCHKLIPAEQQKGKDAHETQPNEQ